jgi:hypothetical protein
MKKIPITVLITTANNPPQGMPHLEMKNSAERRIAAKAALYFWASQGVKQIVVADATASNLLSRSEIEEIGLAGVPVEQISYEQNSNEISLRGKGYGEGELIRFALNNSRFLKEEENFFKSSGKTYVRNLSEIYDLICEAKVASLFWKHLGDGTWMMLWADCRFYFSSREFAIQQLLPAYSQADDRDKGACEFHVYQILNEKLKLVNALRPQISGFSGGTGLPYFDGSLGSLDYRCPGWIEERSI